MAAANIDIEIEQGSKFDATFTWYTDKTKTTPKDITGWTGKMQIRAEKDINSTLIHEVSSAAGNLIITGSLGTIKPVITATETNGFTFEWAWYSIELTPPSGAADTKRIVDGKVRFDKSTTA